MSRCRSWHCYPQVRRSLADVVVQCLVRKENEFEALDACNDKCLDFGKLGTAQIFMFHGNNVLVRGKKILSCTQCLLHKDVKHVLYYNDEPPKHAMTIIIMESICQFFSVLNTHAVL